MPNGFDGFDPFSELNEYSPFVVSSGQIPNDIPPLEANPWSGVVFTSGVALGSSVDLDFVTASGVILPDMGLKARLARQYEREQREFNERKSRGSQCEFKFVGDARI